MANGEHETEKSDENGATIQASGPGVTVPTKTVATVLIASVMAAGSLFVDTFIFENNDRVDQISGDLEIVHDDIDRLGRELKACRERYERSMRATGDLEVELKEHKEHNSALRDKVWEFQAQKNVTDEHQTKLIERCMRITGAYSNF